MAMVFDPAVAMAVAVESHKGIYSLLLGSGVSRGAGIPTGWEVIQELIRRLALASGEDVGGDASEWYRGKFKKEPNYSELLEMLAPTPAERTSLLKEFFEPTDDERDQGLKVPTEVHKAVARLVAGGYVRVIVTTNFDRLLEQAIQSEGVSPTVVSTPDQVEGMMPLPHVRCLVLKVHGDYLDTRLRNTPSELAEYPAALEQLLATIFADYGLIICGWSGDWDVALADAITRTTRFRFSTYWLARGGRLSKTAQDLVDRRRAVVVPIEGADSAFNTLTARVEAIANHTLADPTSPAVAIATMKRLMSEPKYRIQLHDFVVRELGNVRENVGPETLPTGGIKPDEHTFPERARQMATACANLVPMVAVGVQWDDGERDGLWQRCLVGLTERRSEPGGHYRAWQALRLLPPTLLLYSMVAAAIRGGRLDLIRLLLLETEVRVEEREARPLITELGIERALPYDISQTLHEQEENRQKKTPGSDWVVEQFRQMLFPIVGSDVDLDDLFDEVEFLVAIIAADVTGRPYRGRFMWRRAHPAVDQRGEFVKRLESELEQAEDANQHPLLVSGLFRGELKRLREALDLVAKATQQVSW